MDTAIFGLISGATCSGFVAVFRDGSAICCGPSLHCPVLGSGHFSHQGVAVIGEPDECGRCDAKAQIGALFGGDRQADLEIVGGVAEHSGASILQATGAFPEDRQRAAQVAGGEVALLLFGQFMQGTTARLLDVAVNGRGHGGRCSAGTGREAECMGVAKADLSDEGEGFFPLDFGFARKADDQVCGDVDVGHLSAKAFHQCREFTGLAAPRHALEDAVRSALQGQMQVGHESGVVEQVDKHLGNIPGLQ